MDSDPAAERKLGSIVDPSYLALVSDQDLRSIIIAGRPDEHARLAHRYSHSHADRSADHRHCCLARIETHRQLRANRIPYTSSRPDHDAEARSAHERHMNSPARSAAGRTASPTRATVPRTRAVLFSSSSLCCSTARSARCWPCRSSATCSGPALKKRLELQVLDHARSAQQFSRGRDPARRLSQSRHHRRGTGRPANSPAGCGASPGNKFQVFAINCAHLGCPVRWFAQSKLFLCPCHGGAYYEDGSRASGPARARPLRVSAQDRRRTT